MIEKIRKSALVIITLLLAILMTTGCGDDKVKFGNWGQPDGLGTEQGSENNENAPTPPVPPTTPPVTPNPPTPPAPPTPPPQAKTVTDEFEAQFSLDVLFIVDNSTSMRSEQIELGRKFPGFINQLKGIDWRIAITTTDSYAHRGGLVDFRDTRNNLLRGTRVLTPKNHNSPLSFEKTIVRNERGTGHEMAIRATRLAIQRRAEFPEFYRPGTPLTVVTISDEDENSEAFNRTPAKQNPDRPNWTKENEPNSLINFSRTIPGMDLKWNAIAIKPGDKNCFDKQDAQSTGHNAAYAEVYQEAVFISGGIMESICRNSYTPALKNIGKDAKNLATSFYLSKMPKPGTVKVEFTPKLGIGWEVRGQRVFFKKTLPRGTKVKVTYEPK